MVKAQKEKMEAAGILSYRVVFFEYAEDGGFIGPHDYPKLAVSTAGSHDLATLHGWWEEHDIDLSASFMIGDRWRDVQAGLPVPTLPHLSFGISAGHSQMSLKEAF